MGFGFEFLKVLRRMNRNRRQNMRFRLTNDKKLFVGLKIADCRACFIRGLPNFGQKKWHGYFVINIFNQTSSERNKMLLNNSIEWGDFRNEYPKHATNCTEY